MILSSETCTKFVKCSHHLSADVFGIHVVTLVAYPRNLSLTMLNVVAELGWSLYSVPGV